MDPAMIAVATAAGAVAGAVTSRTLAGGRYRRGAEIDRPTFIARRWIPLLTALGAAAVACTGSWQQLVLASPLLTIGIWLAAVDADVQRLPFLQVVVFAVAELASVTVVAVLHGSVWPLAWGAGGGLLAYLGFRVFHALARGQLGYGDVTLAVPLGMAATSLGGAKGAWIWLMAAFVPAATYGLARHRTEPGALGPWLILGAVVALTI